MKSGTPRSKVKEMFSLCLTTYRAMKTCLIRHYVMQTYWVEV